MPYPVVAPVEVLSMPTQNSLHPPPQLSHRCLSQKMDVIWHQTEGVNNEDPLFYCLAQKFQKYTPVLDVKKGVHSSDTPGSDVI